MMDRKEFDDIILYCINEFFKGIQIQIGKYINARVKSVVQKLELEDGFLKNHGILFELENNTYFRLMFETKYYCIELIEQITIDTRLYNLEDKKIYTIIINTVDAAKESCYISLGSINYEPQNIGLFENDGEQLFQELKRKVDTGEPFDNQDKVNLILYPLMDKSEFILERALKIIDLVKRIKNKEQRLVLLGAVAGVAEKYVTRAEVKRIKEVLMMTELGYIMRQEGVKDGIKESIFLVLLNKFETIPEVIYDKINEIQDESILRGWLSKAINCISIKDLEVN